MNYIGIGRGLLVTSGKPSVNACYGPYESTQAAHADMVATYGSESSIPIGLTVGIQVGVNIVEYWYNGGQSIEYLIPKIKIDADSIDANAITEDKLADNAVTESKLKNGAVTENKIAANAVTENKIADNAVTESKLKNGAVTENKLADAVITENKIADNAVTESKLKNSAVTENKLADAAITENKIADKAVSLNKLSESLQQTLSTLATVGYKFGGVALLSETPAVPTQSIFKIASTIGTYTNYNLQVTEQDGVCVFLYDKSVTNPAWTKLPVGIPFTPDTDMSVQTFSGSLVTAEVNKYYRATSAIESLSIVLPAQSDVAKSKNIMFYFEGGANPSVVIAAADDKPVMFYENFQVLPGVKYELNAMFNGSAWIIAYGVIQNS